MHRKSLIVADAAGPDGPLLEVLGRFGFGQPDRAPSVEHALSRLRQAHYDLAVLPIQDLDGEQLAEIERLTRIDRATFLIGTAPQAESQLILRAMRAGIHEFLVHPPEARELAAAVGRLDRRGKAEPVRGKVIAVYSAKGGLGTTSVAVNLAHAIAKQQSSSRVALADLVVTGGDVKVFLNLSPTYDMGDLQRKLDRVDANLLFSILTPYRGFLVLPSPDSPEADESIDAAAVAGIIGHLRSHVAFTVFDCEHHMSDRTLAAMDAADRIVLVTQLTVPALRSTQRSLDLCRRLGYTDDKLCVVITRSQASDVLTAADAAEALKVEIFWRLPNDYRLSSAALTKGLPVAEVEGGSKLAWSYGQLATKLTGAPGAPAAGNGTAAGAGSPLSRLFGKKPKV